MFLAWGNKVSPEFRSKAVYIAKDLGIHPDWLMACMAFETGRTFDPAIKNAAGSGAVGLIQFMPATARGLGTTTEELAVMDALEQLNYVAFYFKRWAGKLHSLEDVYMAILWPAAVGKEHYVLFDRNDPNHPKRFIQNAGLDFNKDGLITKAEATAKVLAMLEQGLLPENACEV